MEIYVQNQNLECVGLIDSFISVIWAPRYYQAGDFELYLDATERNIGLLQKGYFLTRTDSETVMIVENISLDTDAEAGQFMTVSGRSLESILGRRIIWQQTNLSGRVEEGVRRLISENAINPSIPSRKIKRLKFGPLQGFTDLFEMQVTGDNLLTCISEICKTYGMGFKIILDEDLNFIFHMYRGQDRSYKQTTNPYIVFSPEFDNILKSGYKMNAQNFKNVALIAGEGEGLERRTQVVGEYSDLDRYELYVDARDISSNNGELTEAEYNQSLMQKGMDSLAENTTTESYEGEIETRVGYKYGRDYFLGDTVQVRNEYGMEAAPTIIEVIESEDESGHKVIPTIAAWEVQ